MTIWQILGFLCFILLIPATGILAFSIKTAIGRAVAVMALVAVVIPIMAMSTKEVWIKSTQESNALPDLHDLCRVDPTAPPIELSYKVSRDDFVKLTNALIYEVGCNVKITRLRPPFALSEAFPRAQ